MKSISKIKRFTAALALAVSLPAHGTVDVEPEVLSLDAFWAKSFYQLLPDSTAVAGGFNDKAVIIVDEKGTVGLELKCSKIVVIGGGGVSRVGTPLPPVTSYSCNVLTLDPTEHQDLELMTPAELFQLMSNTP